MFLDTFFPEKWNCETSSQKLKAKESYNVQPEGVKSSLASKEEQKTKQVAFMTQKLNELAQKAKLRRAPDICVSKNERFASVNIFQKRISVGEHLLSLWTDGKFSDDDVEATLAHEVGHLMDFGRDSDSTSFRNLLAESLWFSFGVVPLIIYLLLPSTSSFLISAALAVGWGFSLPFIVRRVEIRIELEADRNAALHLVAPDKLATALVKISSHSVPPRTLGFTARLSFLAGIFTHPSFSERVQNLKSL